MNAKQIVDYVLAKNIMLSTDGERIHVKANSKPDPEILSSIKAQREAVIAELKHRQQLWLLTVAQGLKMTPADIIKHQLLIVGDVRNWWHTAPQKMASFIRSSYRYMEVKK